jgi:hypothetical protein
MKTKAYLSNHLKHILFLAFLLQGIAFTTVAQIITTIAGNSIPAYTGDGFSSLLAQLDHPKGVAIDNTGNIYIADAGNNVIRKINIFGIISTIAGNGTPGYSGDGLTATAAELNAPNGVLLDSLNNLYICDADNYCIRKVNTAGIISTVAGTGGVTGYMGDGLAATAAQMSFPAGIAMDPAGNLFIADEYNNCIRKVNTSGIISTYAGAGGTGYTGDNGAATAANIGFPLGVAADGYGNVYISLYFSDIVCKVNTAGIINNIAGTAGINGFTGDGGPATAGQFDSPWGIASDGAGNVYVADNVNERIRRVNASGILSTVAGNGSSGYFGDGASATLAELRGPAGVMVAPNGTVYIADYNNHAIRRVAGTWTNPPSFTGGHLQSLPACENASMVSINSLMAITDIDAGQWEVWHVVTLPLHGTLFSPFSAVSTGGTITPTGLSYKPATGYTGTDSFRVRITDGTASDTTKVVVTVTACPTGIAAQVVNSGMTVFPNPNTGTFTFNLSSVNDEKASVVISNIVGKKVKKFTTVTNTATDVKSDVPNGIYFLNATTMHGQWNGKILVEK